MEQLPNAITESFPFMMTASGQGMALSMVRQFISLITSGIQFGTFAKSINEAKRTKYWIDKANYYDNGTDIQRAKEVYGTNVFVKLFSPYSTPGEYNGIPLKSILVKELFLIVSSCILHAKPMSSFVTQSRLNNVNVLNQSMRAIEPYMQESFQLNLDEGESADHSFKAAKMVKTFFRTGKIYSATYDSLSLNGFVNFNRFCHTKSNEELEPILQDNAKIRKHMGAPELKVTQGDGGGDSCAWKQTYKAQLRDSTQKPRDPSLPVAKLIEGKFKVLSTARMAENAFLALSHSIAEHDRVIFGLDTEADDEQQIRVIQICLPSSICKDVFVLDLTQIGALSSEKFQELLPTVKSVLKNAKMEPVAVNITYDVNQLEGLGIHFKSFIDVRNTAKELEPNHTKGYGIQALCRRFLGYHVEKELQTTNWAAKLTNQMAHYAALDAFMHLFLYETLQKKIYDAEQQGRLPINPSRRLNVDQGVNLTFNKRVVATGTLVFVGSNGNMQKFGTVTVGKDKSVVLVEKVLDEKVRPVYCFKPSAEEKAKGAVGWDHTKVTLSGLLEKGNGNPFRLSWPTHRLTVNASGKKSNGAAVEMQSAPVRTLENYLTSEDCQTHQQRLGLWIGSTNYTNCCGTVIPTNRQNE